MRSFISQSTNSPAGPTAPAMALMEVLTGAAILALAALAFLAVLAEARADLAHARRASEASAVAASVLREARSSWMRGPYSGERDGYAWRLTCEAAAMSPRLALVSCSVWVSGRGFSEQTFSTAWAAPRADVLGR